MGIKVPLAQENVGPATGVAPVQKFSAPPQEAFGGSVAAAGQKAGQAIAGVGDIITQHAQQKMYWDAQEATYDASQRGNLGFQDLLYGEGKAKYKDSQTKQEYEIERGLMNRKLREATVNGGVASEFREKSEAVKAQILEPLKNNPYVYRSTLKSLNSMQEAAYNRVIAHQASEDNAAKVYTFKSNLETQIADIGNSRNADEVNFRLHEPGMIVDTTARIEAFTGIPQEKRIGEAVEIAVMSKLQTSGSLEEAQAMLDGVKGVPKRDYDSILFKLKNKSAAIQEQAEKVINVAQKSYATSLYSKAADNTLTPEEVEDAVVRGGKGLPNGIDSGDAGHLKSVMGTKRYKAALSKRKQLNFQIPEQYFLIQDSDDVHNGGIDDKTTFDQISNFRNAAAEAYQQGAITKGEFDNKMKRTETAFTNATKGFITEDHENGQAVWKYTKGWLKNYFNYKAPGETKKIGVNKEEFEEAAGYIGSELMAIMEAGPLPKDKVQPLAQALLQRYVVEKHPELLGKQGMPNSIMEAEASFRNISDEVYAGKPDVQISSSAVPKGMVMMTAPDGSQVPVHPTKVKQAKERGLT